MVRREIGYGKLFYWYVLINIVNLCKFIYIKVKMILLKIGFLFGFDILVDCWEECLLRLVYFDVDAVFKFVFIMY